MKKIIAIILGILVLTVGLLGCASCKPEEPDPRAGLYGTYQMVAIEVNGKEFGGNSFSGLSQEVIAEINDFIEKIKAEVGDYISITKEKVAFLKDGNLVEEFEYHFSFSDMIYFEVDIFSDDFVFPFYCVRYTLFTTVTPQKYQISTHYFLNVDEESYTIRFFYSEREKFN